MSEYIKIWRPAKEYEEIMHVSRRTINRRIKDGDWLQGVHWNYDGGKLILNFKELDKLHGTIQQAI